jgi:hypothetical protein
MIIAMRLASLPTAVSLVAVPATQAKTLKVNWREVSTRS